jgi:hypothetical protein
MITNSFKLNLLASALVGAGLLFSGSASACSIALWEGATTAPANAAAEPTPNSNASPRYSGRCGLQVNAIDSYVGDNSPNGTTDGTGNPYRARVYVWTGWTGGTATVMRAASGDDGAGTQAFAIKYNPTAGAFEFEYGGPANVGTIAGIVANRWYGIEVNYQGGQALQAFVQGGGSDTELTFAAPPAAAPATPVGSIRLGVLAGSAGAGRFAFDDFESTRSGAARIGFLCRADADGSGARNSTDGLAIRNEFLSAGANLAGGQPDCDQNGVINSTDGLCVRQIFLSGAGACPTL